MTTHLRLKNYLVIISLIFSISSFSQFNSSIFSSSVTQSCPSPTAPTITGFSTSPFMQYQASPVVPTNNFSTAFDIETATLDAIANNNEFLKNNWAVKYSNPIGTFNALGQSQTCSLAGGLNICSSNKFNACNCSNSSKLFSDVFNKDQLCRQTMGLDSLILNGTELPNADVEQKLANDTSSPTPSAPMGTQVTSTPVDQSNCCQNEQCIRDNVLSGENCNATEDSMLDNQNVELTKALTFNAFHTFMQNGQIPSEQNYDKSFCNDCIPRFQRLNGNQNVDFLKMEDEIKNIYNNQRAAETYQSVTARKYLLLKYVSNHSNSNVKDRIMAYLENNSRSINESSESLDRFCEGFNQQEEANQCNDGSQRYSTSYANTILNVFEASESAPITELWGSALGSEVQDKSLKTTHNVLGSAADHNKILNDGRNSLMEDIQGVVAASTSGATRGAQEAIHALTPQTRSGLDPRDIDRAENYLSTLISNKLYDGYDRIKSLCVNTEFKNKVNNQAKNTEFIQALQLNPEDYESVLQGVSFLKFERPGTWLNFEDTNFLCDMIKDTPNKEVFSPAAGERSFADRMIQHLERDPEKHFRSLEDRICYSGKQELTTKNFTNYLCGNVLPSEAFLDEFRNKIDDPQLSRLSEEEQNNYKLALSRLRCYARAENYQIYGISEPTPDLSSGAGRADERSGDDDSRQLNCRIDPYAPECRPTVGSDGRIESAPPSSITQRPSSLGDTIVRSRGGSGVASTLPTSDELIAAAENSNRARVDRNQRTLATTNQDNSIASVLDRYEQDRLGNNNNQYNNQNSVIENTYANSRTLPKEVVEEVIKTDPEIREKVQEVAQNLRELDPQNQDPIKTIEDSLSGRQRNIFNAEDANDPEKQALQRQIDELRSQLANKVDQMPKDELNNLENEALRRRIGELENYVASVKNGQRSNSLGGGTVSGGPARGPASIDAPQSFGAVRGGTFVGLNDDGPELDAMGRKILSQAPAPTTARTLVLGLGTSYQIQFENDRLVLSQGSQKIPIDLDDIVIENGELKRIVYKGSSIDAASLPESSRKQIVQFIEKKSPELLAQNLKNAISRMPASERPDAAEPSADAARYNQLLCAMGDSACIK